MQRSTRVGYKINKVVYRGYHASDQLQVSTAVLHCGIQGSKWKRSVGLLGPETLVNAILFVPQAMQDSAIASRAKMRLEAELEEQNQKLTSFKLQREQARGELRK